MKSGSGSGSGSGDPLDGMPPIPPLKSARPGGANGSAGSPAGGYQPSAASLSLAGAGPASSLISDMMQLEQLVMRISRQVPALANVAGPFIQQMRDLGAASMADKAGGGIGATNPEQTAPPPGMGGAGGPGGPGGPGGGGMPMMPPPPVMAGMR